MMEQRIRKTNDAITPFTLAVPQADLEDLNRRIDQTRWPDAETVDDWTQGAPLAKVKALVDHWRHRYDWRRCEAMLNNWSQYKTTIDGLDIHFLHVRPCVLHLPFLPSPPWGPPPAPRSRLLRQADRHGLGRPPDRQRLDRSDATPRLHPLGRPGRRLGLVGGNGHRRDEA